RGLALARAIGDAALEGYFHLALGRLAQVQGKLDVARTAHSTSVELYRRATDALGEVNALLALSQAFTDAGDPEQARRCTQIAAGKIDAESPVDRMNLGLSAGYHEHAAGRLDQALRLYGEALAAARQVGDGRHETVAAAYAALARFEQGAI